MACRKTLNKPGQLYVHDGRAFKTGAKDGNCLEENSDRLAEFWERGWTECGMMVWKLKVEHDITKKGNLKKCAPRTIFHVNIFNEKTDKMIDVSNGMTKMIDREIWLAHNGEAIVDSKWIPKSKIDEAINEFTEYEPMFKMLGTKWANSMCLQQCASAIAKTIFKMKM